MNQPYFTDFNGLAFINFKIKRLITSLKWRLSLTQGIYYSCSSSIISKETGKKSDGVIGCDEQQTTINPSIGLDFEAVNILSVSR